MIVYLDTSIVLRALLGQGKILDLWGRWQRAYSSEILGLEARRVIDRLRLDSLLDEEGVAAVQQELGRIERTIGYIAVSRPVLRRASLPMATAVKTLDAIHLASALLFQERRDANLLFATHDRTQGIAARALGFEVTGI